MLPIEWVKNWLTDLKIKLKMKALIELYLGPFLANIFVNDAEEKLVIIENRGLVAWEDDVYIVKQLCY